MVNVSGALLHRHLMLVDQRLEQALQLQLQLLQGLHLMRQSAGPCSVAIWRWRKRGFRGLGMRRELMLQHAARAGGLRDQMAGGVPWKALMKAAAISSSLCALRVDEAYSTTNVASSSVSRSA